MVDRLISRDQKPYSQEDCLNDEIFSSNESQIETKKGRYLGSVYTPPEFAQFLTSWAIRSPQDKILDVGIGEGVFIFAAYHRLLHLGAKESNAQHQLYGAEIDEPTYNRFIKLAHAHFPNLHNTDFFKTEFPPVDAVVGNPPYVRRTYIKNIEEIRKSVTEGNFLIKEIGINRTTDLYIYFLLHALSSLKPGGRLAVITADPWLNVDYGEAFKKYLQSYFKIESLISLDRRVFTDAEVKPVLLLATKNDAIDLNRSIYFIRVKNGLPVNRLQQVLEQPHSRPDDVIFSEVKTSKLAASSLWSIHFKAPGIYEEIASNSLMTSIANLAQTRIGLQTLAKDFFVLTKEQIERLQLEVEFLAPLAQSLRYFDSPTISPDLDPKFCVFYCSEDKEAIQGTHALEYILKGETTTVQVRGKNITLIGYHNKERIKRSGRKIWYDIKTSIEDRGRSEILIPRLIYHNFKVLWNKAHFVPGELFIEFFPRSAQDTEIYLAVLNSTIAEIMLRVHAQVYGGGTYNINPGEIKNVPILNVDLLTNDQKKALKLAYTDYVLDAASDRSVIDNVINEILGFSDAIQQRMKEVLEDLLLIAASSKKTIQDQPVSF